MDVKWETSPTLFDQKGCGGLYIKEITVKWWLVPILCWMALKYHGLEIEINIKSKKFKIKVPRIILFVFLMTKSKLRKSYTLGG